MTIFLFVLVLAFPAFGEGWQIYVGAKGQSHLSKSAPLASTHFFLNHRMLLEVGEDKWEDYRPEERNFQEGGEVKLPGADLKTLDIGGLLFFREHYTLPQFPCE